MKNRARTVIVMGLAFASLSGAGVRLVAQDAPPRQAEVAELLDGTKVTGRLVGDGASGFGFVPEGGGDRIVWGRFSQIRADPPIASGATTPAPFQFHLGTGHRLSGRLIGLDDSGVTIDPGLGRTPWKISRAGVSALVQRPGEVQTLSDGFETLDPARWSRTGSPELRADRKLAGERALNLPAGSSSITTRLAEPLTSGRVELAFWDDTAKIPGQRWYVDLTFRKPDSELSTLRIIAGWAEDTLAVETPSGPSMTVQPLARKSGWRRLSVRFEPDRASIGIDGDNLAHGRGLGGPLVEARIATETLGAAQAPPGLSAVVDEFRIVRLVEPSGRFEVDPSQDEVRLATGDQLFGVVESADGESIRLRFDGKPARTTWAEASGIYPKRSPGASAMLDGHWAEVEWKTTPGDDPRDLDRVEGVVSALDDATLTLDIPYAGQITIPRSSITRIAPRGRGARMVVDSRARHLGDRISTTLEPPQAEAAPVEFRFTAETVPPGPASLLIDALEVIGEEGTETYSAMVKAGELRTSLTLNDQKIGDLNTFVSARTEAPHRMRIPISDGVLKVGENTLRIDQIGTKSEPKLRDNLGITRIAVEFSSPNAAKGAKP